MTGFKRTSSIEAISGGWAPKTASWFGRETVPQLSMESAAMAMCGVDPVPLAFWLVSMGHQEMDLLRLCALYLRHDAREHVRAEKWRTGRLEALVALCLDDLARGHADAFSDEYRMQRVGIAKSQWWALWKQRYGRMMGYALGKVAEAHAVIGPRLRDVD